jgi:hypothetical protein
MIGGWNAFNTAKTGTKIKSQIRSVTKGSRVSHSFPGKLQRVVLLVSLKQ